MKKLCPFGAVTGCLTLVQTHQEPHLAKPNVSSRNAGMSSVWRVVLSLSYAAGVLANPSISSAQQTVGGGTISSPAQGPAASFGLGAGATLVKNWDFGTNGTIKTKADMDTHFRYHDQFGVYINGTDQYGAQTVASSSATALSGQRVEGVTAGQVRQFFSEYLRTYLVPLDGDTIVSPTEHNVGCGSFVAKWELPRGGALLGQDIIWETRLRYDVPRYFWLGIWVAGNIWMTPPSGSKTPGGAEIDLLESFGYENPGGFTNFDGSKWHTASVGGLDDTSYSPGWTEGMRMRGIDPNTYNAQVYHIWTLVYRADDTYSCYVDGIEVQNGTINWTYGATEDGTPIDMTFLWDGAWGHTRVAGVNKSMPASELANKYYEWDYSRVYLRPNLKFQTENVQTVAFSSGDSVTPLVDAGGSAGGTERFNASGANDFVTYTLPGVPAGTYSTRIGVKPYTTRGKFQLSIDGVNQGSVQDLYANPGNIYYDAFVGSKTFSTTGNRAFKFTVTGKHTSSTDYDLGLDYIHLVKLPTTSGVATTVTMNSGDSGKITLVGPWVTSKSTAGYFGPYYRHDGGAGKGFRSVRYTPELTAAGNYQVAIRYPAGTNRATNVPVDIVKSDGTRSTVIVNQTVNSNVWITLGTYALAPGISSVTIRNTGTAAAALVVADGVRFTPAP